MPYEIVDTITYDAAAKDLSVEVAKAKASKAEMLMPICRLNDAKLIVQEMVKQRWEPMTHQSRHARHVRAGLHQEDGEVRRIHAVDPALAQSQVADDRGRWRSITTRSSPAPRSTSTRASPSRRC